MEVPPDENRVNELMLELHKPYPDYRAMCKVLIRELELSVEEVTVLERALKDEQALNNFEAQ